MKRILNWCKQMCMQKDGHMRWGRKTYEATSVVHNSLQVEENTIFLNRREASFINREVHRLLKAKLTEEERKKKEGIPGPPAPGKISYAVYQ